MPPMSAQDFARRLKLRLSPWSDHHFSGPPENQRPPNTGAVDHLEGCLLAGLAHSLGGPVLEIGADHGVSTRYIHEGLESWFDTHPEATPSQLQIFSVDVLHKWADDPSWPFRRRITADSAHYVCPARPTFAFVDGDHRYDGVQSDAIMAISAGARVIVFHDTGDHLKRNPENPSAGSDAREAVPAVFSILPDWTLYDLPTPCGLMVACRNPE